MRTRRLQGNVYNYNMHDHRVEKDCLVADSLFIYEKKVFDEEFDKPEDQNRKLMYEKMLELVGL